MRAFLTGSAGMLGSSVYPAFVRAGHAVTATDLVPRSVGRLPMEALDVRDFAAVCRALDAATPDIVLHLAAETDLEICEADPDHAYRTNAVGTQYVAVACQHRDIPMVYISTAGVFDGTKVGPYTEFDAPNPINVYGSSKLAGERFVAALVPRHFIVRAGWMVGGGVRDHKFVAKILEQLRGGAATIYAVTDRMGTPTYTEDFAANLLALIATPFFGLYHMTGKGEGSRYDVAREIVSASGFATVRVEGVTSGHFAAEYPAPRPVSEAMRNYMLELHGIDQMRPWREALRDYLADMEPRV